MSTPELARKGSSRSLPAGDRIEEFEILEVIGEGAALATGPLLLTTIV